MAQVKEKPLTEDTKPGTALEQSPKPGTALELYDPGEDAGAGMEDVTMEERRIPFLRILDPKSPQCKPTSQGGLPGAKGGALLNTSTNQVYDGEVGVTIIPCSRDQRYVEYIKRNEDGSGGGFVGVHEPDEDIVLKLRAEHGKFGKLPMGVVDDQEHELTQTFYLACIVIAPNGESFRAYVGFTSTQIKKYQAFVDRYDNIKYQGRDGLVKPALWAHRWHLKTQYESKGTFSWYGFVISLAEKNPDGSEREPRASLMKSDNPLYIAGKEFYTLLRGGVVKADFSKQEAADKPENDIPFEH